jgi:hypothetical protein
MGALRNQLRRQEERSETGSDAKIQGRQLRKSRQISRFAGSTPICNEIAGVGKANLAGLSPQPDV